MSRSGFTLVIALLGVCVGCDFVLAQAAGDGAPNIDLAHALELAGVANPTVNRAREAAREAEALLQAANALKLPSMNTGFNVLIHRGNLERSAGAILDVDRQSFYFGAGARAVGGDTVAFPGVRLFYPLADVLSEPQAAQQRLISRRADALAIRNLTLLDVATTYLTLKQADAAVKELRRSEVDFVEIVRRTEAFAKTGQGREADANRALTNLRFLQRQHAEAVGERIVVSARLAGLLSLDPTVPLILPVGSPEPLQVIDMSSTLDCLIAKAEANRPELRARTSDIAEARVRERQEQIRPYLPTIVGGFSVGGFGGSSNLTTSEFGRFSTRTDFDIAAVWTFQNLGLGNRFVARRHRAVVSQSVAHFQDTRNGIREDVVEAHAQVLSRLTQIEIVQRRLTIAEEGYREESMRIQQGQGLPLEVLDSARSLMDARLERVSAISQFNIAQFRLLSAVAGHHASNFFGTTSE